jgi:hypothetical protein
MLRSSGGKSIGDIIDPFIKFSLMVLVTLTPRVLRMPMDPEVLPIATLRVSTLWLPYQLQSNSTVNSNIPVLLAAYKCDGPSFHPLLDLVLLQQDSE